VNGIIGSTQIIKGDWSGIEREGSKTNKVTGAGVNSWLKKGLQFSLGLHTTVFQAELYAIKA
jgi:hypothetical protein